jgi:phenylacetate-CoA ligase
MNWRSPLIQLLLSLSKKKISSYLKEIEYVSYLSPDKIKSYQDAKLSKLLLYAYHHVPYYREILADTYRARDGAVEGALFQKIPVLTKDIIRSRFDALVSTGVSPRSWYRNSSGGSSGEPVSFFQDKEYLAWNIAYKLFIKKIGGQSAGDPELRLWGSERDILEGKEKLSVRLRNWLYNRRELNTFSVSDEEYSRFIADWNSFSPEWVEAYVQSIYDFALFIESQKASVYSPRGIVTSAGTLYPDMKDKLQDLFKCPVFNRYGSREVGDMACSCKASDFLHLAEWAHYFEILDESLRPARPGEIGTVYVTLLTNFAMPLIRYKVGDAAVQGDGAICSCGLKTRRIQKVIGREVHIFKTRVGRKIDGEYFTHLFYHKAWVKKFQVVQKTYDLILIKIVGDENSSEQREIEHAIRVVMGNECQVQWEFVAAIQPLASGKFLYTVSEVE